MQMQELSCMLFQHLPAWHSQRWLRSLRKRMITRFTQPLEHARIQCVRGFFKHADDLFGLLLLVHGVVNSVLNNGIGFYRVASTLERVTRLLLVLRP